MRARRLILASSSAYRQTLLKQLGLTFTCESPGLDETPRSGESAAALTRRLALAKASLVLRGRPNCLVIGADQTADLNGQLLGKPHSHERAVEQLRACSGNKVKFHTAVALLSNLKQQVDVIVTEVHFRCLGDPQIEHYIKKEEPLDCAGSFKCEGLGIALFESIETTDPSALIGLPLIALTRQLFHEGVDVLTQQ